MNFCSADWYVLFSKKMCVVRSDFILLIVNHLLLYMLFIMGRHSTLTVRDVVCPGGLSLPLRLRYSMSSELAVLSVARGPSWRATNKRQTLTTAAAVEDLGRFLCEENIYGTFVCRSTSFRPKCPPHKARKRPSRREQHTTYIPHYCTRQSRSVLSKPPFLSRLRGDTGTTPAVFKIISRVFSRPNYPPLHHLPCKHILRPPPLLFTRTIPALPHLPSKHLHRVLFIYPNYSAHSAISRLQIFRSPLLPETSLHYAISAPVIQIASFF